MDAQADSSVHYSPEKYIRVCRLSIYTGMRLTCPLHQISKTQHLQPLLDTHHGLHYTLKVVIKYTTTIIRSGQPMIVLNSVPETAYHKIELFTSIYYYVVNDITIYLVIHA